MDYDFSRLNTRSFEQLIQALASEIIGPRLIVFGDGPDGGREATFEGLTTFPDVQKPWNGYGVVQVKFRQKSTFSGKDADWLLSELKQELEKFQDDTRKLRKPEYYIIATNVVLSPMEKKGGKDKIIAHFNTWKETLGLKEFLIWDYDQIRSFLDRCDGIRKSYSGWITPGDVIAEVLKQIQVSRPDFRAVMRSYLMKELVVDQYINLDQAGCRDDKRSPLARVFVDLPVGDPDHKDSSPRDNRLMGRKKDDSTTMALGKLHSIASLRLDPISLKQTNQSVNQHEESLQILQNRIVFVGGPGQGKSTLSQFLCQIHRLAFLSMNGQPLLSDEVQQACDVIFEQCKQEKLTVPDVPRFPLRVELNRFARELAEGEVTSLFSFILERMRRKTEREISSDDLRGWLGIYPWMLILDGLDEVPASANRKAVLEAVQEFCIDAHEANADILILATTRPQGYNQDFSPNHYSHYQLIPLNQKQSLHCALRLARERWGNEDERFERVKERLQRAVREESTVKLMQSPLQVAIMTLLIDQSGDPPRERWRLFKDYYNVIYNRERQRDIPAAKLLRDYQPDIDFIHQMVGMILQSRSERAGGTEAILNMDEFEKLVNDRLKSEEHKDSDRSVLARAITEAALHRLVFLVSPQEETIGFEIRSLQEFMAAECIMNGSDEQVKSRLRAIAHSSHWRNVMLFAAGHCFQQKQHLRDTLHTICHELNEDVGTEGRGPLEKTTLTGSRLALEILEDGAVSRQPAQISLYLRLAFRLTDLPLSGEQLRVAKQYNALNEDVFRDELETRISGKKLMHCLGAWRILLFFLDKNVSLGRVLAEKWWPEESDDIVMMVKLSHIKKESDWIIEKIDSALQKLSLNRILMDFSNYSDLLRLGEVSDFCKWYSSVFHGEHRKEIQVQGVSSNYRLIIEILSDKVVDSKESIVCSPNMHPELKWLVSTDKFIVCPSVEILTELVSHYNKMNIKLTQSGRLWMNLPWPLGCCIAAINNGCNPDKLVDDLQRGKYGNEDDWFKAEIRWKNKGVTFDDVNYQPCGDLLFDDKVSKIGFPIDICSPCYTLDENNNEIVENLLNAWENCSSQSGRRFFAQSISYMTYGMVYDKKIVKQLCSLSDETFYEFINDVKHKWFGIDLLPLFLYASSGLTREVSEIDKFGRSIRFVSGDRINKDETDRMGLLIEDILSKNKGLGGFWNLLAILIRIGYKRKLHEIAPGLEITNDNEFAYAIHIVELAQENQSVENVRQNARWFAEYAKKEPEKKVSKDVINICKNSTFSNSFKWAFLVVFYDSLPVDHYESRQEIMDFMLAEQRQQLAKSALLE